MAIKSKKTTDKETDRQTEMQRKKQTHVDKQSTSVIFRPRDTPVCCWDVEQPTDNDFYRMQKRAPHGRVM